MKQVTSLEELKQAALASDGPVEGFIRLNHGAKSSKSFQYFPDGFEADDEEEYVEEGETMLIVWEVHHDISDTYEGFESDDALLEILGDAINKGAFYLY